LAPNHARPRPKAAFTPLRPATTTTSHSFPSRARRRFWPPAGWPCWSPQRPGFLRSNLHLPGGAGPSCQKPGHL